MEEELEMQDVTSGITETWQNNKHDWNTNVCCAGKREIKINEGTIV